MTDTPDILKKILDKKAEEVARRRLGMTIANLEEIAGGVEGPRGFYNALQSKVLAKKTGDYRGNQKSLAQQRRDPGRFPAYRHRSGLRNERRSLLVGINR